MATVTATEHETQVAIFEWAAYQSNLVPELEMLHATPNGQYRPGQRLEAGTKKGYPDISLDVPHAKYDGGVYHGFRLELKVGKNRLTPEQEWWLDRLQEQGYRVVACWGFDAAIAALEQYLSLPALEADDD